MCVLGTVHPDWDARWMEEKSVTLHLGVIFHAKDEMKESLIFSNLCCQRESSLSPGFGKKLLPKISKAPCSLQQPFPLCLFSFGPFNPSSALKDAFTGFVRRVTAVGWMQEGLKFIWLTLCLTRERQRKACAPRSSIAHSGISGQSLFHSWHLCFSPLTHREAFILAPFNACQPSIIVFPVLSARFPVLLNKPCTASFSAHLLLQSSWKDNEFGISRWRIMNIPLRQEEWRISPLFFSILFWTNSHFFDSDIRCCEWLSMGRECAFYSFPPRHFTPFNPLSTSSYFVRKIIIIPFKMWQGIKNNGFHFWRIHAIRHVLFFWYYFVMLYNIRTILKNYLQRCMVMLIHHIAFLVHIFGTHDLC